MALLGPALRGVRRRAALVLALGALALAAPPLRAESSREYDVKAVLLYNFTQFVSWPKEAFAGPDDPVVIGVLGRDPFGVVLDDLLRQETAGRRRIVVERYHSLDEVVRCQVLFVSASERGHLTAILAALRGRPILTVADMDGFTRRQGMVDLATGPERKIRLKVNLDAVRASGLHMSAKLLRAAEVETTQAE